MILRIRGVTRNAALDNIRSSLDVGSGPATIAFYTGTQPANGDGEPPSRSRRAAA